MRTRPEPRPVPERAPYFRAQVFEGAEPAVLRAPSLPAASALMKSISQDQQAQLLGIARRAGAESNLLAMLLVADEVLPLLAALVGIAWADPGIELEAARDEGEPLERYGARVYEEMHEAGWSVEHVVKCATAVVNEVLQASAIDREVAARLAFLAPRRASASASGSPSRPTTSDASEDEPSTN
jgi:hypothetical protein